MTRFIIITMLLILESCIIEETSSFDTLTQEGRQQMTFNFKEHNSIDTAKKDLEKILHKGIDLNEIKRIMKQMDVTLFDQTKGNVLAGRYIEPSSTMVHVVWNIAFYLDSDMKLERIELNRGLVGP